MGTRIVLVDDHSIMRAGLRHLLEQQPGVEVVAEAEDGRTAIRVVSELLPEVVIMDIAMPDLNGVEATRRMLAEAPNVKVIVLSMLSDRRLVVEMLKVGAVGYLSKSDCTIDDLIRCIHAVLTGQVYLGPSIARLVVSDYLQRVPEDVSIYSVLTDREREVFQLLAEGKTVKEIAARLYLSRKTVETHRRRIMTKLGVRSTVELLRYAAREDYISLKEDRMLKSE